MYVALIVNLTADNLSVSGLFPYDLKYGAQTYVLITFRVQIWVKTKEFALQH